MSFLCLKCGEICSGTPVGMIVMSETCQLEDKRFELCQGQKIKTGKLVGTRAPDMGSCPWYYICVDDEHNCKGEVK